MRICLGLTVFTLCFSLATKATELEQSNKLLPQTVEKSFTKLIPAYRATYSVLHKSDPVGEAIRELSYLEDNSIQYHYETDISWLIFSDKRQETAIVTINQNKVIPSKYSYQRQGTGPDKSYQWQYDLLNKKATNLQKNKQVTLHHSDGLLDKLSYHLQNRIDLIINPKQKRFVYPVIGSKGTIKNYEYQYDGAEELILPYGLVNTIRLKREVNEKKRITYAWFAPELDYLLVKIYQIKSGAEQFEAQLSELEYK